MRRLLTINPYTNPALIVIDKLFSNNKLEEALKQIDKVEKDKKMKKSVILISKLIKSKILIKQNQPNNGFNQAQVILKEIKSLDIPFLELDTTIVMGEALFKLGKLEESLNWITKSWELLENYKHPEKSNYKEREALILYQKGKINWKKGKLDQALVFIQKSLEQREGLENKQDIAETLNFIGVIYFEKGNLEQALQYYKDSLARYQELENKTGIANTLFNIGNILLENGELDLALENYLKCLAIEEEQGNKYDIASILGNIGILYNQKGELDQALKYYHKGLALEEEVGNQLDMAISLANIGSVYIFKGDLDLATEYYHKSLVINEKIGNKIDISTCLNNLAEIYQYKGQNEIAFDFYKSALENFDEIGNNLDISVTLLNLIKFTLEKKDVNTATNYFQKLKDLNKQEEIKSINQRYRIADALLLKNSTRTVKKAKAQEIFQQISEEQIVDHDLTILAMVNLCELLLLELKTSGDEEVLLEVKTWSNKLLDVAQKQMAYPLLVETHLLQSKLALIELDINKAQKLLNQARSYAEEKGLHKLAIKVSADHDVLLNEQSKWNDIVRKESSIAERIELAGLEDAIFRMLRKKVVETQEAPQDEPVMLLILAESGISVYSKNFQTNQSDESMMLVAGFLTAINSFSKEVFAGAVDRIKIEDNVLLMKTIETFLVCYIFKGQSYSAIKKLDRFIETFHQSNTYFDILMKSAETGKIIDGKEKEIFEEMIDKFYS
ncbi:MAG: tetratricopeptide repeat protein [Candidatus Hodarchaeales archaeon]|jgi:tetratricopeptide (TPR) repeat protein